MIKEIPPTMLRLEVTTEQAHAISEALEAYSRLGIGQIEHVAELFSTGVIPVGTHYNGFGHQEKRKSLSLDGLDQVRDLCKAVKAAAGYTSNGSNGIGHSHVAKNVHRAWEVKKVLDKALAEWNNPEPSFRGVHYDGLTLRYTNDPAPVAQIIEREVA